MAIFEPSEGRNTVESVASSSKFSIISVFPSDRITARWHICLAIKQIGDSMRSIKLVSSAALAAGMWLSAAGALAADTTVRLMHVDQNPDTGAFYNDVARRFESTHPGVKVEIQYLENESYKKKLTTLLQSPDRPNILYSWGGGTMRDQIKARVLEAICAPMGSK